MLLFELFELLALIVGGKTRFGGLADGIGIGAFAFEFWFGFAAAVAIFLLMMNTVN